MQKVIGSNAKILPGEVTPPLVGAGCKGDAQGV